MTEILEGLDVSDWPEYKALAERLMLCCSSQKRSLDVEIDQVVIVNQTYFGTVPIEYAEDIETPRDLNDRYK